MAYFVGFLSKLFNRIFSVTFLRGAGWKHNIFLGNPEKHLSDNPNYVFALLLGWQLLGEEAECCLDPIRGPESAGSLFLSRLCDLNNLIFLLSSCRHSVRPGPVGVVVGRSTGRMWVERVCHPKARRWQELSRAHPLCGCHQRRQKSQIWSCHFLGSPPPFRMVTSSISFPASSPTVLPSQQEARPKPHGHLVVFDQTHLIHARAFHALFSRPGELISSFYFHLIKYFCSF